MWKDGISKKGIVFCVCLLVVAEFFALFLMYKSSDNKASDLATVKLDETFNNKDMFAIMLEEIDEEGNSTYVESNYNTWPTTGYTYDADKSGCIDNNGNKLVDALVYDVESNIASVNTMDTSYCYLYFNIVD